MEKIPITIDTDLIKRELDRIMNSDLVSVSDKKLDQYQYLSELYSGKNKGIQAPSLMPFNNPENRSTCKLTRQKVEEIRKKHIPNRYGKAKLAKEYGVSRSVISRIVKGQSWK
jgi:hypothetical protein